MNEMRDTLLVHIGEYNKRVLDFNTRCTGVISPDNWTLIDYCTQESAAIEIQSGLVDKERDRFLFFFHDNERIYEAYLASKQFQDKEQERFDQMNAEWKQAQKDLVLSRLQQPNPWARGIVSAMEKNEPPLPYKKMDELQSGDVILFSPNPETELTLDKISGKLINMADRAASLSGTSTASHTVTFLKEENGKKLFLDNTPAEGPHIITQEALLLKYGDRKTDVAQLGSGGIAQPLTPKEAMMLLNAAREMERKNAEAKVKKAGNLFDKNNYGILKENLVCSEASWMLLKSTGRTMPLSRSWATLVGIDFSPSDFYQHTQYFLVTPLELGGSR